MPNYITNTAIVNESWNARGLITHNAVTKALIRADDHTLWAAVREGHVKRFINIYRSTDNGFSWEPMFSGDFKEIIRRTGLGGLNQNGPFMHLTLSEEYNKLILWHSFYNLSIQQYDMEPFIFHIEDDKLVRVTTEANHAVDGIALGAFQLATDISYTTNHIYLTYLRNSSIWVKVYNHTYQTSVDGEANIGNAYFNVFATRANNNSTLDIAALKDNGSNWTVEYIRWNRLTGNFTTPVTVSNFAKADVVDMNIERDGENNLMMLWSQETGGGTDIIQRYAISKDNGSTWTVHTIPKTPNQSNYRDLATDRLASRTVALGGIQGFLLGYVRRHNDIPRAYIRTLLFEDGDYVLGPEKRAVDQPVTGFRFFRPTNNQLLDLDQIGQVRIAYQIGDATSQVQVDSHPVIFGQQLLREAQAFAEPTTDYQIDEPEENQLLFSALLLGAIDENIDYYNLGLTGPITNKYIDAIEKVGTVLSFYRYEPTFAAESSDRNAYGDAEVIIAKAALDPTTYEFPVPRGGEDFTTYIERDSRRLYLPPTLHISRTYLVNRGNHLKRTVWLFRFAGNEYEISQVVPRFLRDQIAFYEANAYVVGPSNDPFSRVVLPSET